MAAQSLLAKLGMRSAALGSAASLAIAAPLANNDQSMAAHTDPTRIGWFFDRTPGAEKTGHVVMGVEILSVGAAGVTSTVKVSTPASVVGGAGLSVPPGTAPAAPVNGDIWGTTTGLFARVGGATSNLIRVVFALTDAANIAVNAALGDEFTVTLGGNRTMDAPTNPTNGQLILFRIKQDGTGSRTVTWNAVYQFTTDLPAPTLSTAANTIDYVGFVYDSTAVKWHCLSYVFGYT